MTEPTPGPWHIDDSADRPDGPFIVRDKAGRPLAYCNMQGGPPGNESVANAELITSAPTLAATVAAQREVIERLGSKFDDALNILADLSAGTPCPPEYPGKGPCEMHGWIYRGTCPQGLAHAFRAEWNSSDTAALQTEHQARREVIGALVGAVKAFLNCTTATRTACNDCKEQGRAALALAKELP